MAPRPRLRILRSPPSHRPKSTHPSYPSHLPRPLILGQTHPSRFHSHYTDTLSEDLLYLSYTHAYVSPPSPATHLPARDTANPYTVHRPPPRLKGSGILRPNPNPPDPENIPRLERIVLHSMIKTAITSRTELLAPLAAFRAICGLTEHGGNIRGNTGVQVLRATHGAAQWKLRKHQPIALKADLRGPPMYAFLESLTEFVLPRLRDFSGLYMPPSSSSPNTPANLSGVVAFGFPSIALGLFPQVEVNFDAYPKMHGFHVLCVTNQRGRGAQDRARQLLSGFRIPFLRR